MACDDVHSIDIQDVQINGARDVYPIGHEKIASYNWKLDKDNILVPGYPPVLVQARVKEKFHLIKDDERHLPRQGYENARAAQAQRAGTKESRRKGRRRRAKGRELPKAKREYRPNLKGRKELQEAAVQRYNLSRGKPMMSEMEALFQAVRVCSPEFSWGGVDMITDSNVLHELLCFCGSPGNSLGRRSPYGETEDRRLFIYGVNDNAGHGCNSNGGRSRTIVLSLDERLTEKREKINDIPSQYQQKLTKRLRRGHRSVGFGTKLRLVQKFDLDGIKMLVSVVVDACEILSDATDFSSLSATTITKNEVPWAPTTKFTATAGSLDVLQPRLNVRSEGNKDPVNPTIENEGSSLSTAGIPQTEHVPATATVTPTVANCLMGGHLLHADTGLIDISTRRARNADKVDWMEYFWRMAISGADTKIVGLHDFGRFNGGNDSETLVLPKEEVKHRAELEASSSMIYLANTLREIASAADKLLPLCPPIEMDGCIRQVVVVDLCLHSPEAGGGASPIRVQVHHG